MASQKLELKPRRRTTVEDVPLPGNERYMRFGKGRLKEDEVY